jgi:2-deoxy-D-gluconate 3-dehydrogenase
MVTGAARGIGLGCAEMLAASGAKVALVDSNTERLIGATKTVQEKGSTKGYELDVTDTPAIGPAVSRIRRDMGEVDILVCCAGMNIKTPAKEVTESTWDAVNLLNIRGLFFCNQAVAVQSMIPRKTGAIVNMASIAGLIGEPLNAAYCASKGGVVALTRQEAVEWAPHNIRVNAVAPTWVLTDWIREFLDENPEVENEVLDSTPLHCMATVEDVAAAVCFLASDSANVITGVTLPVDAGWTAQ